MCFSLGEEMTGSETCVRALASAVYLDHVKMILIRENSVHLTVQLLELLLDGVGLQCVVVIFADEVVACKIRCHEHQNYSKLDQKTCSHFCTVT